jgi:chorismate mutase
VIDDPEISQLRLQIDDVDLRILGLLTERVRDHKRKKGLGVTDPERERRLLDRLASHVEAPLDAATVRRIFECIVTESRRIEHEHVAE